MAEFSSLKWQTDLRIDKAQYILDEHRKLLNIWKERVRRYFPKIDQEAVDYRVNDDDTGVKVLEDDGTIFEITIDKGTSVAMARLCPSDEPWSFEY